MSLKDDFLEALRSVKRDFFRESDDREDSLAEPTHKNYEEPHRDTPEPTPYAAPSQPDNVVFQSRDDERQEEEPAYRETPVEAYDEPGDDYYEEPDVEAYDDYIESLSDYASGDNGGDYGGGDGRYTPPGDDGGYDVSADNRTIISKNTVINGSLQTDDSLRLLGQVMGDIDCKSNIVVAGKVRGNTTAANAYVFDAQVEGDLRCADIVNVGTDAWILGNIRAQQAEIDGKIKGNIEIRHMVSIGANSSVLGDISTDELEIKRGAFINGQVMMYSPSRDVLDRFDQFEE